MGDKVSPAFSHEAPNSKFDRRATSDYVAQSYDVAFTTIDSGEVPQEMFTSAEVYNAMASQEWAKLGHAESELVAATDERAKMNFRAVALLEHHLTKVIKKREPNAFISLSTKIQLNKFVAAVSQSYNDVKFHSYSHALHVMTSMNVLLSFSVIEDPLNSLSLMISALMHDVGHTGKNDIFAIDTWLSLVKCVTFSTSFCCRHEQ